jgi:hypothetical protein
MTAFRDLPVVQVAFRLARLPFSEVPLEMAFSGPARVPRFGFFLSNFKEDGNEIIPIVVDVATLISYDYEL